MSNILNIQCVIINYIHIICWNKMYFFRFIQFLVLRVVTKNTLVISGFLLRERDNAIDFLFIYSYQILTKDSHNIYDLRLNL